MLNDYQATFNFHVYLLGQEAGIGCRKMRQKVEHVALGFQLEFDRTASMIVSLRWCHTTFNPAGIKVLRDEKQPRRGRASRSAFGTS